MACPKCGCKVTYQYDEDNVNSTPFLERCANCGAIVVEEEALEEDDYPLI